MSFKDWLQEYLIKLNSSLDGELIDYMIGLLDDINEDEDEVKESLVGLLEQIASTDDLEAHCMTILKKYKELSISQGTVSGDANVVPSCSEEANVDSVTAQMKEIINLDKSKVIANKGRGSEKGRIKLHNHDGEVSTTDEEANSDTEDSLHNKSNDKNSSVTGRCHLEVLDDDDDESETDEEADLAIKNMSGACNRERVTKIQHEQREKQRNEHARKKEMDKASRAKQLEQQKARKEAEKKRTQKGERRR